MVCTADGVYCRWHIGHQQRLRVHRGDTATVGMGARRVHACTSSSGCSEIFRFTALDSGAACRAYVWDAPKARCVYETARLCGRGETVLWCAPDSVVHGPVTLAGERGRTAEGHVAWTVVDDATLDELRAWSDGGTPPPWPVAACPDGIEPRGSEGRSPVRVAVVTPTVGGPHLEECIASVQAQDLPNVVHWVVVDGAEHEARVRAIVRRYEGRKPTEVLVLPRNVGRAGGKNWYGHRVNGSLPFLVDADFVCFLDEDNAFEPDHVRLLCRSVVAAGAPWGHSLRRIVDEASREVCLDCCESLGGIAPSVLGDRLVDTSCFMMRTEVAVRVAPHWYDARVDLRASDRRVLEALFRTYDTHAVSRHHSVRYRVYDTGTGVPASFFLEGNARTAYDFTMPDVYVFGTGLAGRLRALGSSSFPYNIIDGAAASADAVGRGTLLPRDAVVACAATDADWAVVRDRLVARPDCWKVVVVGEGERVPGMDEGVVAVDAVVARAGDPPVATHAPACTSTSPGAYTSTYTDDDDLARALAAVLERAVRRSHT